MSLIKHIFNPLGVKKHHRDDFDIGKTVNKRKIKKRFWRVAGYVALGVFIWGILMFAWYSKDLPTPNKIKNRKIEQATQLYDRNGKMIFAIAGDEKRIILKDEEIPKIVKDATVAIEDQNFYHHIGLDFKGIARALISDVARQSYSQGGSTITQQLVKNALLTSKKSLSRKIKEAILSVELEVLYSKDRILSMYLNEIPYGSTSYGIEAASQSYFGKKTSELTLAEAAVLAAIPQAPTYYSPYGAHVENLLKRKDKVINNMVKLGYISENQAEEAKKVEIKFLPKKDSINAPHFVFYVQEYLEDKYGKDLVNGGGLKVTTTLDLDVQAKAQSAIDEGSKKLDKYGATNAALVSIKPGTGEVLTMVGSRDYFNDSIKGQVNVATSARQPGSSFKPIVYATAFKDNYNPAFTLFDLKTDFGNYAPDNYTGQTSGPVTMRHALANSLNIPAVKTLSLAGLNKSLETAHDLGITTLNDPDRYGLALVLGGGEVKPIEMANAFAVFGNSGNYAPINPILKVESASGEILEEFKSDEVKTRQVLDPQIAFQISDILSDNNARTAIFGSRNNLAFYDRPVAVKTGTTQEFHDAWTVGFTPQISTAVWVGNSDNTKMKNGADGSVLAAPIWHKFMEDYLKTLPVEKFTIPDGVSQVEVDKLSNKLPSDFSPERIKDWFASWQAPKNVDDIHIKVKVNKLNGKLATDSTPPELIEEKLYTNIHSEKPDNPAWEGPVRAWAQNAGISNLPPADKDDMYANAFKSINFINPTENTNISGKTIISVSASSSQGVKEVAFALDNNVIGT
ncbi:MAG: 1A family penicillin-binding protein, partial [Candidatus Berkelbacteria bacterium Licking1014_85]